MTASTETTTQTPATTTDAGHGTGASSETPARAGLRIREHIAHVRLMVAVHALCRSQPHERPLTRWVSKKVLHVLHEDLVEHGMHDLTTDQRTQ